MPWVFISNGLPGFNPIGPAAILVATAPRLTSQALAFDIIGRNAIIHSPDFQSGHYYDQQSGIRGLAVARMIGHITYLSREAMRAKFGADRNQPREENRLDAYVLGDVPPCQPRGAAI